MIKTIRSLTILAIAAVMISSISVGTIAFADDDDDDDSGIPQIEEAEVKIKKNFLKVKIETEDDIPTDGSAGLFGYAVLTSGLNNVLAVTTHLCAADSTLQSNAPNSICPDASAFGLLEALSGGTFLNKDYDGADWHPHILDLKSPDGFCFDIGADLEVDLASTVGSGNNVSPTDYKLKVDEDTIKVKAPLGGGDVTPDGSGIGIVSFEIGATTDGAGTITDLCVLNVTPFSGDDD